MKIKFKLILGIGFLFIMIVLLTALSTIFINRLSADTKNILVANYNSLDYSRQMIISLNNGLANAESQKDFKGNLEKQQFNITEAGEQDLTDKLVIDFNSLTNAPGDSVFYKAVQKDITDVMLVNMQAIQRKSAVAQKTADSSILWITLTGTICFLIAFTMLFNLPGNIANPIKELTKSIEEIAAQNYSQRVHFEHHNEFGQLAASFNTMAEKLEEYKAGSLEKLMVSKQRIETLINNMNDPVIGLDENNLILFMNNVALKITGISAEEAIGKNVRDVAMQNDLVRTLVQELFNENKKNPENKSAPIKIYADNKESYFEKDIIPIKIIPTGEKEEKQIGNVIVLQNVTPYKELDFAKTNFIATVSHELKTPIASIKMSLQLLENEKIGGLNTDQHGLMESIKEDADRLLKITGELLNMTQVESGRIQMNIIPFEAKEIIEYAVNANNAAAEQKQIKLIVSEPLSLPKIIADTEKSSWVLTNLISNAIRYSYENSIVAINVVKEGGKVRFSVIDSGQGISPQYISKIFERYFRIPGTKEKGTGLGLSISKEFIEAQGGEITVKSDFGAGSTFSFTLNYLHSGNDSNS
ncbi:MAG: ATP-binding protein [Bacteroidota bacterium]|nr:ATP-binding protein [Bacteroidota bacterium]